MDGLDVEEPELAGTRTTTVLTTTAGSGAGAAEATVARARVRRARNFIFLCLSWALVSLGVGRCVVGWSIRLCVWVWVFLDTLYSMSMVDSTGDVREGQEAKPRSVVTSSLLVSAVGPPPYDMAPDASVSLFVHWWLAPFMIAEHWSHRRTTQLAPSFLLMVHSETLLCHVKWPQIAVYSSRLE